MNINVTFRHLPSSDALKQHSEEKISKLSKYLADPVDAHVVLTVEKIRQIAEITMTAKGYRAHALEESSDMYTSIDMAVTKLESQIRKHKEKIKEHKGLGLAAEEMPALE